MALSIRIYTHGGPEVLKGEDVSVGTPGPGELRIRQTAIGVNFIDIYNRMGLYPMQLPGVIGMEAAGVVEEVGASVAGFHPGDRVAYASGPLGAYASERLMPALRVVSLPPFITDDMAAASMVKGMTAEFLVRRTFPVKTGDRVLIHAAAGGVGSLLVQWAAHLGAEVIATAGGAEKCAIAKIYGARHVIDYTQGPFATAVREFTGGKGVNVVYDGVGAATFMESLDCLSPLGMMVSFGNASGPVPAIEPKILAAKGSLFLTRPSMGHYTKDPVDYQNSANALFDVLKSGAVKVHVGKTYDLRDAAQAHSDLEARRTNGSLLLKP